MRKEWRMSGHGGINGGGTRPSACALAFQEDAEVFLVTAMLWERDEGMKSVCRQSGSIRHDRCLSGGS